jgi:hypothetical protein
LQYLSRGFRDGEDGFVWFSKYLDCWGESGRHLPEEILDIGEEDLAQNAKEAVADEELAPDGDDDWVRVEDQALIECFVWYAIPATFVNNRSRVRLVPPKVSPYLEFEDEGDAR